MSSIQDCSITSTGDTEYVLTTPIDDILDEDCTARSPTIQLRWACIVDIDVVWGILYAIPTSVEPLAVD